MTTQEKLDRLPKWAQSHIRALQQKVNDQERRLEVRVRDYEDARIFIDAWEKNPTPIGGQHTTVRFILDPGSYNGYVDVSFDQQRKAVRVSVNGQLTVLPVVSNGVLCKVEEF